MKKWSALLLALIMAFSLCSCGKNKEALKVSEAAYTNISDAYELIEKFSSDVYAAWRAGIYDENELTSGDGVKYLASRLNLTEDELCDGTACLMMKMNGMDWNTLAEEEKDLTREIARYAFVLYSDDLFSFCVNAVETAYELSGRFDTIQTLLNDGKTQLKTLSEKYSDYEHYSSIKGYYTSVCSFFEFCKETDCNFKQLQDTINDYRSEIRDYKSNLDYIFEE